MDIDERREDDGMEVEEEPSTNLPIPEDEPLEEVLQDDEVMGMEINQAFDATNPISIDADIELDDEEDHEDGDDMEPEPTPIEGATEDPFFIDPLNGVEESGLGDVDIDEAFGGVEEEAEEIQEDETPQESKDALVGSGDPLMLGAGQTSGSIGGIGGVLLTPQSGGELPVNSTLSPISKPSTQPETLIPATGSETRQPESTPAELAVPEEEDVDEEIYPEDAIGEDIENEEEYNEDDIQEEDYEEEDEDELHDPRLDEMLTIYTMPSVLLHLVGQPPKALFFPLDPADGLPDGVSALTPVWFEGRHAELAQIPLTKLLEEIRQKANKPEFDHLEMSIEEKGLAVKLCQHDVHLNQVTLLEYLQVHYSCGLPSPVQLFVTFAPDRFWNRFDSIRKELVKAAEERKLAAIKRAARGDADDEQGQGREVSEDGDEGYASGEEEEQTEEIMRRPKGDDNRAVYEESQVVDRRGKRDGNEVESAHPNADWATKLATGPLAFGIGNTSGPNPRSPREPSQPIEAPVDAPTAPEVTNEQTRGRSSKKEDDDQLADTTEASSTDSRHPEEMQVPRPALGLDEIALKKQDEAIAESEVGTVTPSRLVPKDEIELLHDHQRVAQDEEGATIDDMETTELSSLAQERPAAPAKVKISEAVSDYDTSLASSVDPATSGLVTPPMNTISETPKAVLPGSSLVNEVVPDDPEQDEGISMIKEDEEDEEEEPLEVPEDGDTFEDEGYYDDEDVADEEEEKDALIKAVDDDVIPKSAAVEAVGGEREWEQYLEDAEERRGNPTDTSLDTDQINAFAPIAGKTSTASSTTVEEDAEPFEDEGFSEPKFTRSGKRAAENDGDDDDDDEEVSSKRVKNDL